MSKQVALITGGASGIGLALAKHLLAKGWKIAIADTNQLAGTQIAKELGSDVLFQHTDVTVYSEQVSMFKQVFAWGGNRLDFFAANAGIDDRQDMHMKNEVLDENGDPKPLDLKTMDVDLTSVIQGCWIYKHFARKNAEPGGKVVITSSVNPQYCTAKHALVGLTRCIGPPFLKNENITVNAICPALIVTSLCPPQLLEFFPKEQLTPMSTALRAYDTFLDDDSLTGQIAELSIEKIIMREQVEFATDNQKWQMVDALEIWREAY